MHPRVRIKIQRAPHAAGLPLPSYKTLGSSGADVYAAVSDEVALGPGERAAIPTGLHFEVPPGFELQVRPRSGWALESGVTLANAPGTLDADYRGELKIILSNHGASEVVIKRGDRIAQLILAPVHQADFEETTLSQTARGASGFGSTGRRD